jgi:hypothetical protein
METDDPVDEPGLTPAEARVLRLAAQGLTIKEIAAELGISPETVSEQLVGIYDKLARSRPDPPAPPTGPPPAASAALAVPLEHAEEAPRHVGRSVPRRKAARGQEPTRGDRSS